MSIPSIRSIANTGISPISIGATYIWGFISRKRSMASNFNELVRNVCVRAEKLLLRYPATRYLIDRERPHYQCPICNYKGPFANVYPTTGKRRSAVCPGCSSYERHRLQKLVFDRLSEQHDWSTKSMLHVAPEPFFRSPFQSVFGKYTTTDLIQEDVDIQADLLDLPFESATFDVIYASHVLEHVGKDLQALSEIHRVLRPGGLAILPVPVVAEITLEYTSPNSYEAGHVRAPGLDYFDRYKMYFSRVELHTSDHFPDRYQVHLLEDRSSWGEDRHISRPGMEGERHPDIVPVCYV